MTGMPSAWIFSSSGSAAWLSSAAKQTASGFFWYSACEHVDLDLDVATRSAGREVDVHVQLSSLLPRRQAVTACQNWCWKPLETMGT